MAREASAAVQLIDVGTVRAFLDERHLAFAERVSAFARDTIGSYAEPASDDECRAQAREILDLLGDAGWLDPISIPDHRAICLAREALAAASPLADAVYALQALGATPIVLSGTDAQRERWVADALAGRAMGAFAMTEPEAGSDVASMTTIARPDGDGWVLDGVKSFISNAGIADFYTTFAQTEPGKGSKGIACLVVPADADGLEYAGPQVLSSPHPLGEIRFHGCRVGADALLAGPGEGFKLGLATLERLRPTVAAAACGMAARALEEALAHATTRRQFGRPLADFQLVQEKLARMATRLTAARLLTYRAAWAKDGGADRIPVESSMAKAYATEAAQRIVDDAVQILGGRGVLAEHPVDRLYRSVRALRIYEGTTEVQHLLVARHLIEARTEMEAP
ncbi:MAG TPA: acyl-CoA dehydrogenase family protein [Gemmatimonadota bacterium]|nr:acyl-CoA dehydrogenase family protein [Gemmatimonadota bacterium]